MSLADLDLFGPSPHDAQKEGTAAREAAPPRPYLRCCASAVVDLSRIDTTPGSGDPFAPLTGMDAKAYAQHLKSLTEQGQYSLFALLARWVLQPSPHSPRITISGPFATTLRTCLERFHARRMAAPP